MHQCISTQGVIFNASIKSTLRKGFVRQIRQRLFRFRLLATTFRLISRTLSAPNPLSFILILLLNVIAIISRRPLARVLPLRKYRTIRPVRVDIMVLHSSLFCRTILYLYSHALQTFPSRRRRIFRRTHLLRVRFHPVSTR